MVRTPESKNTHLHPRLPKRDLPSSSRRAPNSRLPAGSRLWRRGRLLGAPTCFMDRSGATRMATEHLSKRGPQTPHPASPVRNKCLHGKYFKGYVCRTCGHALQHEDGRRKAPTSNGHKKAAAQAPSCPARQLRKMAELMGPCVKEFSTRAPPPSTPARQHRLRFGAMTSGPFSCSEEFPLCSESLTALRLSSTASPKP